MLSVALFSLAGLPFFAGFVTKFYLFTAGAESGFLWLSGLAMAASLVSLYYYLRVIQRAYVDQPLEGDEPSAVESSTFFVPSTSWLMLGALLVGMILIGVWPTQLAEAAESASATLGGAREVATTLVR